MVIWIIGLSGAGKTTVGRCLYRKLKARHGNLVYLDGDDLRDVWGDALGHDLEARRMNAQRVSRLCALLDKQGIHVITAILSIFPDWQQWNRETFSRYFQVFLDVPLDIVEDRDPKGIYAAARRGEMSNVIGVDLDFPPPYRSDLVLSGPEITMTPDQIVSRILQELPPLAG